MTIVGLGPGDPGLLTREAVEILQLADELYVRTNRHPTLDRLPFSGAIHSFDRIYSRARVVDEVYPEIARRLIKLSKRRKGVVYAVPGHPLVGERSVRLVIAAARMEGIEARVVAGLSFIEPTLQAVGLDPLAEGLTIVDAQTVVTNHFGRSHARDPFAARSRSFDATVPTLFTQLDSDRLAANLKLVLLEWLPPEHLVVIVRGAGTLEMTIDSVPVVDMDRRTIDHLTSLFVPPIALLADSSHFESLRHVTARLRSETGCPWDRQQTASTLKKTLIEEAYESVDAIDKGESTGDWHPLAEELGDLLLNVVLQAQIAQESDRFAMEDVIKGITEKLIRRHPHVFGDVVAKDQETVVQNWDRIKKEEKGNRSGASCLGDVPTGFPALLRAEILQRRAVRNGFAWTSVDDIFEKLDEELSELRGARTDAERSEELGDVVFVLVALAGFFALELEEAVRQTTIRFATRFQAMERIASDRGIDFVELPIASKLAIWRETKVPERPMG